MDIFSVDMVEGCFRMLPTIEVVEKCQISLVDAVVLTQGKGCCLIQENIPDTHWVRLEVVDDEQSAPTRRPGRRGLDHPAQALEYPAGPDRGPSNQATHWISLLCAPAWGVADAGRESRPDWGIAPRGFFSFRKRIIFAMRLKNTEFKMMTSFCA